MKKVHVNSIRLIGVIGLVLIVLVFLTVPPSVTNVLSDEPKTYLETPEEIINQAVFQNSIVNTDAKFTESNDSILQQFLDSQNIDLPLPVDKFGIETQTALIDSDQNKFLSSSVFGVPQLSVTDEQGRLLDLGSIQTSFLGVMPGIEKSVNVWGKVKFYLDDQLVADKYLWVSASNTNKAELFITSNLLFDEKNNPLPPLFSDRKTIFTFTLSDEGRDWTDGSEHYYRVVITDIHATLQSDNKLKMFAKTGENIVYQLKVKVDGAKKVVLGVDNIVTQVFKSDGTLRLCASVQKNDSFYVRYSSPVVSLLVNNVQVINNKQVDGSGVSERDFQGLKCELVYSKIPRNSNVSFIIDGERLDVKTPLTQKNYDISTRWLQDGYGGNVLHGHVYSNIENFTKPTWDTLYHPTHRPAIGLP